MSYKTEILNRIANFKHDHIFILIDFLDLADFDTVRSTLNRLVKEEKISRVMNGFYRKPSATAPNVDEVAKAIARKNNLTIAPAEEMSLYLLGFTEEKPDKHEYITEGRSAKFSYDDVTIEFKHRAHKDIFNKAELTAMVIQVIKSIGKENITNEHIQHLRERIPDELKPELLADSRSTSEWIYRIISKICKI